jgi:hypothetical protein
LPPGFLVSEFGDDEVLLGASAAGISQLVININSHPIKKIPERAKTLLMNREEFFAITLAARSS